MRERRQRTPLHDRALCPTTNEQRQRGGNAEFLEFIDGVLSKSIASGYGDEDLSAVIKLWRSRH